MNPCPACALLILSVVALMSPADYILAHALRRGILIRGRA